MEIEIKKAELPNECPWCGTDFVHFHEVMEHEKSCSERQEEDPDCVETT